MKPVCVFSQENKESLSKKLKTDFICSPAVITLNSAAHVSWLGSKWPPHYRHLKVILTWVSVRSPLASEQLTDTWRIFQMAVSSDHSSACVNDQSVGAAPGRSRARWFSRGAGGGGSAQLLSWVVIVVLTRSGGQRWSCKWVGEEVNFRFDIDLTVSAAIVIINPLIDLSFQSLFKQKHKELSGSSLIVRIYCFSLSFLTENEESWGFKLLVGQWIDIVVWKQELLPDKFNCS